MYVLRSSYFLLRFYFMATPSSELTRAEEQVMQILWRLGPSAVKDVLAELPAPQPALTTVSTIVRILEQKGFVGYEPVGRGYRYYPLVAQDENLDATQLDALLRAAQEGAAPDQPTDDTPDDSPTPPLSER